MTMTKIHLYSVVTETIVFYDNNQGNGIKILSKL